MSNQKIDVFVLIYKGCNFINRTVDNYRKQENCPNSSLRFVITKSENTPKEIEQIKSFGYDYSLIEKDNFSHSITRQQAIMNSGADIAVMITQDCELVNNDCLEKLCSSINDQVVFSYLRQVDNNGTIEQYTRALNYSDKSLMKDKNLIPSMGINTFFASDACSAYNVKFFKK